MNGVFFLTDGVHLGFLFEDSYLKSFYLNGVVVQLVRTPACHAGGHEFETRQYRTSLYSSIGRAADL